MPRLRSPVRRRAGFSELDAIEHLRRTFAGAEARRAGIELGIGDDAAVIRASGKLVWTVDTCVEHVHFEGGWLSLGELGWKSFHAAASDLAAMGARPLAALSSLILPPAFGASDLSRLARGQQRAARAAECPLVGGNLSRGAELSITTTLIGRAARPLLRSGARPGDELWLVGELGWARLGLVLLQDGARARTGASGRALAAWRRPHARLAEGLLLGRRARAAIDVSDGLAGDAAALARASTVRVVLESQALGATFARGFLELCADCELDPLECALHGGEDYALLASGPAASRPRAARRIGRVERGRGAFIETARGCMPAGRGFDHFRRRS